MKFTRRLGNVGVALTLLAITASTSYSQGFGDLFRGMSSGNQSGNRNSWGSNQGNSRTQRYHSDASDGPSNDWIRPNSSSNNDGMNWPGLIGGLIDAADQAARNNRRNQNNRDDYYYNDNRNYYQPQPQYYYQPQPQPATVQANVAPKPVEKILGLVGNSAPNYGGAELSLTGAERDLMTEVAKDKASDKVDSLKEELGPAADDPATKKELKDIQDKIDNGERVTEADIQEVIDAATKAGLPPGFDGDKANKAADQVIKYTDIVVRLDEEANQGGPGGLTGGPTDVIFFPGLPQDDMVMLPDGSVMIGTGGQGIVTTASMDASDVFGVPVGIGEPVPDYEGDIAKRVKEGVLVLSPVENEVPVSYVIANTNYTIQPGYTQPLPAGRTWVIEFDRGEGFGQAKYTLSDGTYAFGPSDKGWELYKQTMTVTIDNSGNENAFFYNLDNTQAQIGPGKIETHTSPYPIMVRFDRGDGKEVQKKVIARKANFRVAVDPKAGFWDLFPMKDLDFFATTPDASGVATLSGAPAGGPATGVSKARAARLRALMLQTSRSE